MARQTVHSLLIVATLVLSACQDKAQPDFAKCVQADTAGNIETAWTACNAAVSDDPNSKSGKAAAQKLADMKPKYDAWKADQAAKAAAATEAQRKADADRARADAALAKAELQALAAKVSCGRNEDEDDHCVSEGKPPKGRKCTGGTYDENEKLALGKGCEHSHYVGTASGPSYTNNLYCCPN